MRDRLEITCKQLSFAVAEEVAKRPVDAQPRTLWRNQCHSDRGVIKCVAKVLFSFAQGLADPLLLGDVPVQLFNVTSRLFCLRGCAVNVLHVSPVSKINNGNDGNRRAKGKEADVAYEARHYPGR